MSLPEGLLEGKYEVVHKISEGGMGAVYKVHHRLLEEFRVIKVIRPQFADSADLQARFRREARTAIRLRHPRIAEIYDFDIGPDGTAYIVMEFIDGKTLKDVLGESGPPPIPLTLEIAVQMLQALGYLHRRGYVHRDIAPDNAMLTRDYEGNPLVKLIDLGIVKRLGAEGGKTLTATGMFVGKARYSSPEQFKQQDLDGRSDLYSFGVMLYELLTGSSPIPGESLSQLIASHLFEPPLSFDVADPDRRVPQELRRIVLRALEKEPDRRMASAREFIELLEPCQRMEVPSGQEATLQVSTQELLLAKAPAPKARASEVSAAVSSARLLVGQSKFEEARTELQHVLELDPGNSEARRLLSMVQEVLQHKAEAQRQGEITRRAEKIEQLVERGEIDAARTELADAVESYGKAELFRQLDLKIDQALAEIEAERQRREARTILADAEKQVATGNLTGALELLGKAQGLSLRDDEVQRLLARVKEAIDNAIAERARLEEERRQAESRRGEARKLVNAARRLADAEDFAAAREKIEQALALEPGDRQVELLLAEVVVSHRKQQEEAERQRKIARETERIRQLIAATELDAAAQALTGAMKSLGLAEVWPELREELAEAQRKAREKRVAELLATARQHRDGGKLEDALAAVRSALALDPSHAEARELLAATQKAYREEVERRAREKARQAALDRAASRLEAEELTGAGEAIADAVRQYGRDREVDALEARLEELRLRRRDALVADFLEQARKLARKEDFPGALDVIRAALGLDGQNEQARKLLREVESAHQAWIEAARRAEAEREAREKARREREEAEAAAAITRSLELGDLTAADRQLAEAVASLGETEPLRALRQRLAKLQRAAKLAASVAAISRLLDRGKLARAGKRLGRAEKELGDAAELRELGERLEQLREEKAQRKTAPVPWTRWAASAAVVVVAGSVGWILSQWGSGSEEPLPDPRPVELEAVELPPDGPPLQADPLSPPPPVSSDPVTPPVRPAPQPVPPPSIPPPPVVQKTPPAPPPPRVTAEPVPPPPTPPIETAPPEPRSEPPPRELPPPSPPPAPPPEPREVPPPPAPQPVAEPEPAAEPEAPAFQRGDLITSEEEEGVIPPKLISAPVPEYPRQARRRRAGGTVRVIVAVLVNESGTVVQAVIKEGYSSQLGFNESALEAAKQARFEPPTKDGIPGKMWAALPYDFLPPR